jgi:hypothetical protein
MKCWKMWKEVVMSCFKKLEGWTEGNHENPVRIASLRARFAYIRCALIFF